MNNKNNTFSKLANEFGHPTNMILADMNQDGKLDLLNGGTDRGLYIWVGDGTGKFAQGGQIGGVLLRLVADLNKDGRPDVISQQADGVLMVALNGIAGGAADLYPAYTSEPLFSKDFNGDGANDLLLADGRILVNDGLGKFCGTADFRAQGLTAPAAAADFDGDGKADILTKDATHFYLWKSGSGGATNTPPIIVAATPISLPIGANGYTYDVATVDDAQTPAGSLTVAATLVPAGLTVSGITNNNGRIRAQFTVNCATTLGDKLVEFTVTDANGATAKTNVAVNIRATTDFLPTSLSTVTIPVGMGLELPIYHGPPFVVSSSFNGKVSYYIASPSDDSLRITNAGPIGTHTLTLNYTGQCGNTVPFVITINVTGETPACKFPVFQRQTNTTVSNIVWVENADFNLDGKQDLAVLDKNGLVTILRGNGAGGFTLAQTFQTGAKLVLD